MAIDSFWGPYVDASNTPPIGELDTKVGSKLLVVIFIIDCSKSMDDNARMCSVNNALKELKFSLTQLKDDQSLDLKVAIMGFTSSARWELDLTPIEEYDYSELATRAGQTNYGNAFRELDKVLTSERFMKHTGKVAAPAIIFLTDGEPSSNDNYNEVLERLGKNGWFAGANRTAVLVGDAASNALAHEAVESFVSSEDNIVSSNSSDIMALIDTVTKKTVAGQPVNEGQFTKVEPIPEPEPPIPEPPIPEPPIPEPPIPEPPIPEPPIPEPPIPEPPIPEPPIPEPPMPDPEPPWPEPEPFPEPDWPLTDPIPEPDWPDTDPIPEPAKPALDDSEPDWLI